jgi:hypothetical protein
MTAEGAGCSAKLGGSNGAISGYLAPRTAVIDRRYSRSQHGRGWSGM